MLDHQELKDLLSGKLKVRKCPECDSNGRQYWDGRTGEGVKNNTSGIDPEFLESDGCSNCEGIGHLFFYGEHKIFIGT